jgi:hypothetical protein
MSSSQARCRGRVQAQGDDIEKDGGYSHSWAQDEPVTDREGLSFLDKIEEQCSKSQKAQRKQAFKKARRFVKNASEQEGTEAQPHSFEDRKRTVKNARVDIEIRSGITFIPAKESE